MVPMNKGLKSKHRPLSITKKVEPLKKLYRVGLREVYLNYTALDL